MKGLVLFLTLAASALPAYAGPGGCHHESADTARISCAEGQIWDEKSASCVTLES